MEKNNNNFNKAEFEKLEIEFMGILKSTIFDEIFYDIKTLRKNRPQSIKSQLCLAFILADSFSRVHKIFQGCTGNDLNMENEKRFREWIDLFVLTQKNSEYAKHGSIVAPNSKFVWNIRNSFLHFYSFPSKEKDNGKYTILAFNMPKGTKEKTTTGFRQKGYDINYVDGLHLINAITEGFMVQLSQLAEMIKENPAKYVEYTIYAHKILGSEGAKVLPLQNNDKKITQQL